MSPFTDSAANITRAIVETITNTTHTATTTTISIYDVLTSISQVVFMFGLVCNFIVLLTFVLHCKQLNIHQLLLLNLSLVNVVACVVQPANTVHTPHTLNLFNGLIDQLGCKFIQFLDLSSISVLAFTLLTIALHRWDVKRVENNHPLSLFHFFFIFYVFKGVFRTNNSRGYVEVDSRGNFSAELTLEPTQCAQPLSHSIFRYILIRCPLRRKLSKKQLIPILTTIWMFGTVPSIPYLVTESVKESIYSDVEQTSLLVAHMVQVNATFLLMIIGNSFF